MTIQRRITYTLMQNVKNLAVVKFIEEYNKVKRNELQGL